MNILDRHRQVVGQTTDLAAEHFFSLRLAGSRLALALSLLKPEVAGEAEEAVDELVEKLEALLPEAVLDAAKAIQDDFLRRTAAKVIQTMCVGHVVDAEIVETDEDGQHTCRFLRHHRSGAEELCLDFGQGWYIRKGETFVCRDKQIEVAKKWLEK
jgi:hypothetical protein